MSPMEVANLPEPDRLSRREKIRGQLAEIDEKRKRLAELETVLAQMDADLESANAAHRDSVAQMHDEVSTENSAAVLERISTANRQLAETTAADREVRDGIARKISALKGEVVKADALERSLRSLAPMVLHDLSWSLSRRFEFAHQRLNAATKGLKNAKDHAAASGNSTVQRHVSRWSTELEESQREYLAAQQAIDEIQHRMMTED